MPPPQNLIDIKKIFGENFPDLLQTNGSQKFSDQSPPQGLLRSALGKPGLDDLYRARVEKDCETYFKHFFSKLGLEVALNALTLWKFIKKADPFDAAPAVGALLYFILPFDLIPDMIPVFGFMDDAVPLAAVCYFFRDSLQNFRKLAGSDLDARK